MFVARGGLYAEGAQPRCWERCCYDRSMEKQELQLAWDSVKDAVGVLVGGGRGLVLELIAVGVYGGEAVQADAAVSR